MIPFPGDDPAFFLSRRLRPGKNSQENPSDRKRPRQLSVRSGSGAAFSLYIDQNLNGKDGCKSANPISDSCALPGRGYGRGSRQLCGHGGIRSGEKRGCPADRRIPGNGAGHERRHPRRLRTGADRL